MNLALGAVLIFVLLTPPIVFFVAYSFGKFAKAGPKFTILDGLLASAIFSLFIHAIGIKIVGLIHGSGNIRLDLMLKLLLGDVKEFESKYSNSELEVSLYQFAIYNFIILTLALALGRSLRYCVLKFEWHSNSELLRTNNKWWYLFNGYYLPEIGSADRKFDLLFIDVTIDLKDETIIYSGYLVDFVCNGEELDRIYLSDTVKRSHYKTGLIIQPEHTRIDQGPISIPGAFFSIAYKDIKNINLRFLTFDNSQEEIEDINEEDRV